MQKNTAAQSFDKWFIPRYTLFKIFQMIVHLVLILYLLRHNIHSMHLIEILYLVTNIVGMMYSAICCSYVNLSFKTPPILIFSEIVVSGSLFLISGFVMYILMNIDPIEEAFQEIFVLDDQLNYIRVTGGLTPQIRMEPQLAWTDKFLQRGEESEKHNSKNSYMGFYFVMFIMLLVQFYSTYDIYCKYSEQLIIKSKKISTNIGAKAIISTALSSVANNDKNKKAESKSEDIGSKAITSTAEFSNDENINPETKNEDIGAKAITTTAESSVASNDDNKNLVPKNEDIGVKAITSTEKLLITCNGNLNPEPKNKEIGTKAITSTAELSNDENINPEPENEDIREKAITSTPKNGDIGGNRLPVLQSSVASNKKI